MSRAAPQPAGLSVLWALASATSFGVITTLARMVYEAGGTVALLLTVRFVVGAAVMAMVLVILRRKPVLPRRALPAVGLASIGLFTMSVFYMGAVLYIPVGLAVLILYSFPLMIAVATPFVDGGSTVGRAQAFALLVAFAGLGLALGPSFESLDWRGLALAFAAAAMLSVNFFANARALRHMDTGSVAFYVSAGCVPLLVLSLPLLTTMSLPGSEAQGLILPQTGPGMAALVFAQVFYLGGFILQLLALRAGRPSRVAPFYNIEPLISIATAALLLAERLETMQYLGGVIVVAALMLSAKAETANVDRRK